MNDPYDNRKTDDEMLARLTTPAKIVGVHVPEPTVRELREGELLVSVRRDRISAKAATQRIARLLENVRPSEGRAAIYDAIGHAAAMMTRQLVTLKRRLRVADKIGINTDATTFNSGSIEEALTHFECDVNDVVEAFTDGIKRLTGDGS